MCSEGANRRGISCPPFLSLLLLFFYGKLPGGKYGGVCHVDAENELSVSLRELRAAIRHTPSLNASKEWYSMKDIPSIWMLLTLAPNSTRLTIGRM